MSTEQTGSRFNHPTKQWIKAVVWAAIYILFIVWVGNYWWLLGLPVVIDAFITKFIPWTWWKKSENKTFLAVMGWVDAIIFALVAVYFINTFLFQNYQIPTSSLEKTLLVGDFLFVSKASYGPRVPNTPFSFPLVQHTFPVINTKSYLEKPQWDYKRLKGFDQIERNDIVVFNFPAGDTVLTHRAAEDYESISYQVGFEQLKNKGFNMDSGVSGNYEMRNLCLSEGREIIKNNKAVFGDIVTRPVDRRENYVKRCVGLPGEFLEIKDRELYIDDKHIELPEGAQHYCYIETTELLKQSFYDKFDISFENSEHAHKGVNDNNMNVYVMPLTRKNQEDIKKYSYVKVLNELNFNHLYAGNQNTYPAGYNAKWTVDNYGPIWIPKAGKTLALNLNSLSIYERAIRVYENNKLEVKNGLIYINDKEAKTYQFKMDYYWMMGDNRHNSADSRVWGFVPEDHVVGRPVLVWLSLNKDKGWFNGKIRFNRFFKDASK